MKQRINKIPDTFIIAEKEGRIIGYINGPVINQRYITDDLFEEIQSNNSGGYLSVLGLVVNKDYQRQGIAGKLLEQFEKLAKQQVRCGVTLTCREALVSLYERYGYNNEGESTSQHAGIKWYNMVKGKDKVETNTFQPCIYFMFNLLLECSNIFYSPILNRYFPFGYSLQKLNKTFFLMF